jgi:outer membrane protein OmpA-like peptidoglycan-associated protein
VQNAYPLAKEAQQLQPQDAAIKALVAELEPQVRNPSREQLVRGLGNSLFRPLRVNIGGAANAVKPAAGTNMPASGAAASRPIGPSINIPVNFEMNSTAVDAQSRPNVAKLAAALGDPAFAGKRFVFVGHADARGEAAYNKDLSQRRAAAIYADLLATVPALKGRVKIEGHGSTEPIDAGNTEAAHRANRRLQVYLE